MPLSGYDDVAFLNDIANDTESTQTSKIMSLRFKVETKGKLINTRFAPFDVIKPCDVNKRSRSLAW